MSDQSNLTPATSQEAASSRNVSLGAHIRKLTTITVPLALSQLSEMAMGVTDTVLLGTVGVTALAVGGLANNFFLCSMVICQCVLAGIGILLSKGRGERDHGRIVSHDARAVVSAGIALALLIFLPCFVFLACSHGFFTWLGEPSDVVGHGSHFINVLLISLLPDLAIIGVCRMALPALGAESVLLWIFPIMALLNGFGNATLIYGWFGLPAMGLFGSAWATTLTSCFIAALLIAICLARKDLRLAMLPGRFKVATLKALSVLGFPIMIGAASEILLFQITTLWAGKLGTQPLAAHQVALNMISLLFMVCLSIGQATNIRVSYWRGAEKKQQALRSTIGGLAIVLCWTFVTGGLLMLFPAQIAKLYFLGVPADSATFATAITLLRIGGIFQVVDGIQTVCGGALRGLGDVWTPMALGVMSYGVIGLGLSYVLAFHRHLGAEGLWIGLSAGLAVTSVLFGVRLYYVFKKMPG